MNVGKYIQQALINRNKTEERRLNGDYNACDALMDLDDAIDGANLTEEHRDIIHLLYVEDLTHEDAAGFLGTARLNVTRKNSAIIRLVAAAFAKGNGGDIRC